MDLNLICRYILIGSDNGIHGKVIVCDASDTLPTVTEICATVDEAILSEAVPIRREPVVYVLLLRHLPAFHVVSPAFGHVSGPIPANIATLILHISTDNQHFVRVKG